MNQLIFETIVLENAIIAFTKGASDEKRIALDSLKDLLVSKEKELQQFEEQFEKEYG